MSKMRWVLVLTLAMLAGNLAHSAEKPALKSAQLRGSQPTPKVLNAALPSLSSEDYSAEAELLQLANQSREDAALPPLHADGSLTQAAREHAQRMVESEQLAHQFAGEAPLMQRIAQVSSLHLDRAGENVAFNSGAARAHEALMQSPPHRQNLLDPSFNVAGIAAFWNAGRLYIVEDFGHEIPSYSREQTGQLVEQAVTHVRRRAGLPDLATFHTPELDNTACALARENRMNASQLRQAEGSRGVVTYTQSQPEILPQGALRLVRDPNARQFAVGTCYARTPQDPAGTYWVAILLY